MHQHTHFSGLGRVALAIVFVASLAACGGGGGDDNAGGAGGETPGIGTDTVAPATPSGFTRVTTLTQQAAKGMKYFVATVGQAASAIVNITLPGTASVAVGDTLTVRGGTATNWRVMQNADQTVGTRALPGSVAPGTGFSPQGTPQNWWFVASSASGTRLAAVANVALRNPSTLPPTGSVWTSADGGATWRDRGPEIQLGGGPANGNSNWASIASSADGRVLAAADVTGALMISTNGGAAWSRPASAGSRFWVSVTVSADGTRMAAAAEESGDSTANNAGIYVSSDSGATWRVTTAPAGLDWRSISSSAGGQHLVAVAHTGVTAQEATAAIDTAVYRSSDSGVTWTRSTQTFDSAYRVAVSQDGSKVVMGERYGRVWTSTDFGATFTARIPAAVPADSIGFNAVATSADGTVLAAVKPGGNVFISTDSGVTWTERETARPWRGVALSADGNRVIAANNNGQIHTSTSNRTTVGAGGYIQGGKDNEVNLIYRGDGLFDVTSVLPAASGTASAGVGLTKN